MGSLVPPDQPASAATRPPELSDESYVRAVLQPPTPTTEDEIDAALLARARELGIDVSAASTRPPTPSEHKLVSTAESTAAAPERSHARTASTASVPADSTPPGRKRSARLSFSQYDRYLAQIDPHRAAHARHLLTLPTSSSSSFSTTSSGAADVVTSGAFAGTAVKILKRGLTQRLKWRRKSTPPPPPPPPPPPNHGVATTDTHTGDTSCICCREDFSPSSSLSTSVSASASASSAILHTLPCGHTYCRPCLAVMISQSASDDRAMPPRCCAVPIPSRTVRSVLSPDQAQCFLRAVARQHHPLSPLPPAPHHHRSQSSPQSHPPRPAPSDRAGRRPDRAVNDHDLDALVLRLGDRAGWRRCYKCRALVELASGCAHVTCRCRAQFCYICGAAWDPVVGCPNYCDGEGELARRRMEREEGERAEARTRDSEEVQGLGERWRGEMGRFAGFEAAVRREVADRQGRRKGEVEGRYRLWEEEMRDAHVKAEQALEDRQVEAEIELRAALEQAERSVRIQLKYMEAYCNGGQHTPSPSLPGDGGDEKEGGIGNGLGNGNGTAREVTRKHRERLSQQYRVRDGLERRHQSQINVLREKQARRMEELSAQHEAERRALDDARAREETGLKAEFAAEDGAVARVFAERKARMLRRWSLEGEVLRRRLEEREGVAYAAVVMPEWTDEPPVGEELPPVGDKRSLPLVGEEGSLLSPVGEKGLLSPVGEDDDFLAHVGKEGDLLPPAREEQSSG